MSGRSIWILSVCAGLLLLPRPASAQTKPDLYLTGATVPYSGSANKAGASFTARYTIISEYAPVSAKFSVDFFYCATSSSSTCDALGSQSITANFNAGQSRNFISPTLKLPTSVKYGTRYVRMKIDPGDDIAESNESNNVSLSTINVSVHPDLSITSAKVPASSIQLKAKSSFTAKLTIQNAASTSAITQAFSLSYYYCPAKSASGCTALGSEQVFTDLYSGVSYSHGSINLVVPATATSGTRYVRILVDSTKAVPESNEKNNELFVAVTINDSMPDLTVDSTTVPYTGSTSSAGAAFTARCQLHNKSSTGLTKDFNLNYYYCTAKSSSGCAYLGQKKVTYNFPGKSSKYFTSPSLALPVTVTMGTGYIRFFVDGTDSILESNESNNDAFHAFKVTAKPDLYVSKATVPASGSVAYPGATFTAKYIVKNQSKTTAFSTSFEAAFYYCPALGSTGCTLLDKQTISSTFNSGAAYTLTTGTLAIPASAIPGFRYIRVQVDSAKDLTEADETNNNYYSPISVTAPALDAGSDAADAGGDAGADSSVADLPWPDGVADAAPAEVGSDAPKVDTAHEGGGDTAITDAGLSEGGKEGWFWPDQALEGGAKSTDAAEKPGPPITSTGCQCSAGKEPAGGMTLTLTLALLAALGRARRRKEVD